MSDEKKFSFKTGDRITVASAHDDDVRVFLAEYSGKVWYVNEASKTAYGIRSDRVKPYVEPFPFKMGDVVKRKHYLPDRQHVVVAITDDSVHCAYMNNMYEVINIERHKDDFAELFELASKEN